MAEEADFYLDESTMAGIRECLDKGNSPVRVTAVDFDGGSKLVKPYLYD